MFERATTIFTTPRLATLQRPSFTSAMSSLTPLSSLRVSKHLIPASSRAPNTSVQHKPVLIYHFAFPSPSSAAAIEAHLRHIGVVVPQWRFTMYDTSHYHSTTHEVLCVSHGRARLCLGGEDNPGKVEPLVEAGDVLVLPAGVAHRLLQDLDGGFQMVGSYPTGKEWDMCYGGPEEEDKSERIMALSWFEKDPIYGNNGPVLDNTC
ncbi:hypothetical protein S40288_03180 [Stachybotrys chartarum IBT 40288]|nr:hypothetical protein S40288_03180 [Stachybotrys chartarum IBT 40288]